MKRFLLNFALTLVAGVGLTLSASAQNVVGGGVKGPDGEPVIGAAVVIEGTALGTSTDVNGGFSLNVPNPKTDVLVINFLGFKEQRVPVNGRTRIDVTLEEDATTLDDIVVVGYGTVKKRDLTGSVVSVKNDDIVIAPTGNPMEALQGRVTGLDITKASGQVGSDVDILLRGSRSIYGDNSPLFVIDGFIGSYNQVNPSDIESIDVLKDASSTAIYGSAGANGVIIITTKRGKEGKASVSFDAYYGISGSANYKHGMIGDEWITYQREAYKFKTGNYPANNEALFEGNTAFVDAYNAGKWIDWVDLASGNTAVTQKYNVSVTGGNEKTKVFASASYANDKGLLKNEDQDRYQLRLNLDQEVFKWMSFGFSSNISYTNRDRGVQNTFTNSLTAFPLGDAYNDDGSYKHQFITGKFSPLGDFIQNQYANNTRATYANANAFLEIRPVEGLSIKSQVSGTLANSRTGQYWGLQASANLPTYAKAPFAQKTHNDSWSYSWENIFSYNKTFAQDHTVGAQFITSWQYAQTEMTLASGANQLVDNWLFHRLISATASHNESDFTQTQQMSFALRFNYSYKGKYLFTFSNRWDGVSWLAAGHKWDSFPAGAVAWRISDENFMKDTKHWLDNLKLRASYGVTGNSGGMGAYSTTSLAYIYANLGVSVDGTSGNPAQYSGFVSSSDVGWEKTYNLNIGLDFGFFNGRLDGSIEWFDSKTEGLLFKRAFPATDETGWGAAMSTWQNLAKTSGTGVELTLNARTIQKKNFRWNTGLTLTWSKEKIDELPDGDLISENLFVGYPIHSLYGFKYAGIWGTDTPQETLDAHGVQPGFIRVETNDKDGDGGLHKYSNDDRQIIGHTNPNWIIGFNNTFLYKNFDLSIYMMARTGQTISSSLLGRYTATDGISTNQPSGADYWTETNQGAYYPRPGTGSQQSVLGALNFVDGSFFKIKNITLGYTLPQSISRKVRMEKLRVYATCYNPYIYAFNKNLRALEVDPETNGNDTFPTYKQFVFGINITF